jgi:hypothetical protein
MSAAFFGLAVLAALNSKLFAVDLLLIENARCAGGDRPAARTAPGTGSAPRSG